MRARGETVHLWRCRVATANWGVKPQKDVVSLTVLINPQQHTGCETLVRGGGGQFEGAKFLVCCGNTVAPMAVQQQGKQASVTHINIAI